MPILLGMDAAQTTRLQFMECGDIAVTRKNYELLRYRCRKFVPLHLRIVWDRKFQISWRDLTLQEQTQLIHNLLDTYLDETRWDEYSRGLDAVISKYRSIFQKCPLASITVEEWCGKTNGEQKRMFGELHHYQRCAKKRAAAFRKIVTYDRFVEYHKHYVSCKKILGIALQQAFIKERAWNATPLEVRYKILISLKAKLHQLSEQIRLSREDSVPF